MKTRALVATNLERLMQKTPALNTQPKVHEITGLSQSTISRILRKEVSIGLDVLESLADAFGCEVADFFIPIGEPKKDYKEPEGLDGIDFKSLSRSEKTQAIMILAELIDSQK